MSSKRDAMTLAMCEQEEILQIALNEISREKEKVDSVIQLRPEQEVKEYATGIFPSLNAVAKANKVSTYHTPSYSGYQGSDWRSRFDGLQDGEEGICRDPYEDYYGAWY